MFKGLLAAIVLFSAVIMVSFPNVSAFPNIGMDLSEERVSGCPGNAIPVVLTISNNDDITHTYFLSLELPLNWKTPGNGFIQPDITLASGESEDVTFWVNPPVVDPGVWRDIHGVDVGS